MSPGYHVNVNNGAQGGNFVNCDLQNNTFNIHSPGGSLFRENYQRKSFIGKGSYGEAWKVQPKNVFTTSQEFMMVKEISCTEEDFKAGINEIEMLKLCRHENIICYIENFYEQSKLLMIMEFCDGGNLAKFIEAQTELLNVDFITEWVRQLTSGVCFIHKKKIIHRDLKPANIFLTSDKKLRIGDFGIAKMLDKSSGLASTRAGTLLYMAPEILGGDKYNTMADMWSLGIIIFEIITYKRPFQGHNWLPAIFKE